MPKESVETLSSRTAVKKSGNAMNKVLGAIVIILGGLAFYFYMQYSNLQENPSADAEAEVNELVAQVGKLIVLPEERPTVATVTDVEKLKDQPFFAKAKNGDKVLIFTQSKKAILFDPAANKIIEVAPINIGDSAKTQVKAAPVAPAPAQSSESETTNTNP